MSKKDLDTFGLNVRFTIGTATDAAVVDRKLDMWCDTAEALFDAPPALRIHRDAHRLATPLTSAQLTFENDQQFRRYMDDNFDNLVGEDRTEGCMQVLVVDNVTVDGNSSIGGSAFFPHCVTPFGRKHGILMEIGALNSTLAHELGHVFSLKHTFESYVGLKANCNKDFPKVKGASRNGDRINLMDYQRKDSDTIVLNECQRDRAAHQRRMFLTRSGETNYRELAGRR